MSDLRNLAALALILGTASVACTSKDTNERQAPGSEPARAPTEVPAGEPEDVIAIAVGNGFACALQRAGTVACWGGNDEGQLGQDHRDPVAGAVHVQGLDDAIAIAAGQWTACAARRSGAVVCWGDAGAGALGNQSEADQRGSVEVVGVRDATALFGGLYQFCATTPTGLWCWGSVAELAGLIETRERESRRFGPWQISLAGVRAVHLGTRKFAYLDDGSVVAWDFRTDPAVLPDVVEVLSQAEVECFVRTTGAVLCSTLFGEKTPRERLRGARQLSRTNDMVVGISADGCLVGETLYPSDEDPSFVDGHDIAMLAPGHHGAELVAIRHDGRVFTWERENNRSRRYVAREIVLPDPRDAESRSAVEVVSTPPSVRMTEPPSVP